MADGDTVIVTAADDSFAELVEGLVESIKDATAARGIIPPGVHIIDLGLSVKRRESLQRHAHVVNPGDAGSLPQLTHFSATHVLSCWVKPRLPQIVAGFRRYLWIDADAWVQDWSAIEMLLLGCDLAGLAVVPEIDRGYSVLYTKASTHLRTNHEWYTDSFGSIVAKDLIFRPVFNGGVWAAAADNAIWHAWRERLTEAFSHGKRFANDQAALNRAIYHDQVDFHPLPSECNWLCCHALPRFDSQRSVLTEPTLPHRKLGVIHLTRSCRGATLPIPTDGGRVMELKLDYANMRSLLMAAGKSGSWTGAAPV